jgi:hypothetical protein
MRLGKSERLIIVAVVAVVAAVFWIDRRGKVAAPIRHMTNITTSPSPPKSQSIPAISPLAPASISTPSSEEERQREINRLEAIPITFFGKVIDQHELPVAGAQVFYTVHRLSFAGNSPVEGPVTDNDGQFEVRTQGPSITVSVSHPQFYKGADAERQIDYSRETNASPYSPKPTRENPTLFRLVKKGATETIIHVPSGEIRLPLDGRSVEINLGEWFSTVTVRLSSFGATLQPNEFRHFDWNCVLGVPNGGGLIERLNALEFLAPESGYLPEIEIQMVSDHNVRWSSRVNKDYFVRFGNGRYARFQITVSGETGFCRYESYLNPSGSRNLEVDPAKLVGPSTRN